MVRRKKTHQQLIVVILFVVQLIFGIYFLSEITLNKSHLSSLPAFDFADYPQKNNYFFTLYIIFGSLTFVHIIVKSIKNNLNLPTLTSRILIFTSLNLTIGAVFSYISHYWLNGIADSLFLQTNFVFLFLIKNLSVLSWKKLTSVLRNYILHFKRSIRSLRTYIYPLTTILIFGLPAITFQFWDYIGQEGRFAMQNAFLFSRFPLHGFSLLGETLKYHWGFDGFVSAFSALLHIPLDFANSLISLLLIILLMQILDSTLYLFKPFQQDLLRASTVIASLLGGGIIFYSGFGDYSFRYSHIWKSIDWRGIYILPPTASYLYQKAFLIGLPIVFLFLLILNLNISSKNFSWKKRENLTLLLVQSVLLCALSLCSVPLFLTCLIALAFTIIYRLFLSFKISNIKDFALQIIPASISGLYFLGFAGFSGLLTKNAFKKASPFQVTIFGHLHQPLRFMLWLVASLGVGLAMGFIPTRFSGTRVYKFTWWGGALLYTFINFSGSLDMIKFMVLPRIIGNILLLLVLFSLLLRRAKENLIKSKAVIVITCLVISLPGALFLWPLDNAAWRQIRSSQFNPKAVWSGFSRQSVGPSRVVSFAKRMGGANGFICTPELINYCGVYGGLTQLNPDVLVKQEGIDLTRQTLQLKLLESPANASDYLKLGFRYLIIGVSSSNAWKQRLLQWKKTGHATVIYSSGKYDLLRLEN
jgi:hypothetical protein